MTNYIYTPSLKGYERRNTNDVNIGDVYCGSNFPIRIQSMTISDTMNTKETVEESIRMIESGCEYIRITAPSIREAENLKEIKESLNSKGYKVPIIADIHFTPNAAEAAARLIEKVRVNPGNYADRKNFKVIEYTDKSYNEEIERIHKRFTPLVKICKEYGTAMRIGTNHGSLSDRILSRYGDTPLGMVESALEFLRICEDHNYHNIVLSMKSSNPLVMVQAYRLLVNRMDIENMKYPLHLGVTEAGEGEEGRIKSALGIGTLLEDGLGDTIRVSLTEPPEFEAPVAIKIKNKYENRKIEKSEFDSNPINPYSYQRRVTNRVKNIGSSEVPKVIASFDREISYADLSEMGYNYNPDSDKWNINDQAADFIYLGANTLKINITPQLGVIYDYQHWESLENKENYYPLYNIGEYQNSNLKSRFLNFLMLNVNEFYEMDFSAIEKTVIVLDITNEHPYNEIRNIFYHLMENKINLPIIIKGDYSNSDEEDMQINASIDFGGLFLDGFCDGLWVSPANRMVIKTVFGILQAARVRISKTEYISCPSCGRTLFDLQETSAKIRNKTLHLKGIKIGIMGCIVNGPGEMADADYGYVGTGIGKISLYRRQDVVKKNIPSEHAVDELIDLIKSEGDWVEPKF